MKRALIAGVLAAACGSSAAPAPRSAVHVPPPRAAPPATASEPVLPALLPVTLHAVELDVASLAAPPPRWSVPAGAAPAARAPDHGVFAALPKDAGVQLLDGDTGAVRWKRAAPRGERWRGIAAGVQDGAPYLAVEGSSGPDKRVLVRLDPASGAVLERRTLAAHVELERGEHGGLELVDRDRCLAVVVDAISGETLGDGIAGSRKVLRDFKNRPLVECTNTVALHELSHGRARASLRDANSTTLATLGPAGVSGAISIVGDVIDALSIDDTHALYAALPLVAQVPGALMGFQGDRLVFNHSIAGAETCHGAVRARSVHGDAALTQACHAVELVDAATGATRFHATARGVALLEGEAPQLIRLAGEGAVEWLSHDGSSLGGLLLPRGAREVAALGDAVLIVASGTVAVVDRDGSVRWQIGVEADRVRVLDGQVLVESAGHDVLVDPRSGAVVAVGRSLGRAAADAGLWVDQVSGEIRALALSPS